MLARAIRRIRGRLTYANVAATLALVLAMSGGALAANHYLINSTRQINPKVLRKLHGARGALGPTGAVGPQGIQGPEGKRGTRGEKGDPGVFSAAALLGKGEHESGEFAVSVASAAEKAILQDAVTFQIPLTAPIENQVEATPVTKPATNCLGPGQAARGWLCIYTRTDVNAKFERAYDPESFEEKPAPGRSGRFGFGMRWEAEKEGEVEVAGTWTVTAP